LGPSNNNRLFLLQSHDPQTLAELPFHSRRILPFPRFANFIGDTRGVFQDKDIAQRRAPWNATTCEMLVFAAPAARHSILVRRKCKDREVAALPSTRQGRKNLSMQGGRRPCPPATLRHPPKYRPSADRLARWTRMSRLRAERRLRHTHRKHQSVYRCGIGRESSSVQCAANSSDRWCRFRTRRSMKWSSGVNFHAGFISHRDARHGTSRKSNTGLKSDVVPPLHI
jgi:hypothetical protein